MNDLTIGIIGCGAMGSAIASGIVQNVPQDTVISINLHDKETHKSETVAEEIGHLHANLTDLVKNSDILIIAVKPQNAQELIDDVKEYIADQVVVSVMAGVCIDAIKDMIGKDVSIARAMPNMSAFVSESITCVAFNSLVQNKTDVMDIFKGIGEVVETEESLMDAVTAVSGSGPAYLFYLADAMIDAALNLGFDKDMAEKLVRHTLFGASKLLKDEELSAKGLIEKVASKGGTTEAALNVLNEKNVHNVINEAISKAKERSGELSRG